MQRATCLPPGLSQAWWISTGAGTANMSATASDAFVLKLDPAGSYNWVRKLGGSSEDAALSVAVDAAGAVYSAGSFRDTVDFDPGAGTANLASLGYTDIFISKLSGTGEYVWAGRAGSATNPDEVEAICVDAAGNLYAAGNFGDTADLDPGPASAMLFSAGASDAFVLKLSSGAASIPNAANVLSEWTLHPNPATARATLRCGIELAGATVHLATADGRFLGQWKKPVGADAVELDLTDISPGVYFIEVMTDDGRAKTLRFIKQAGF